MMTDFVYFLDCGSESVEEDGGCERNVWEETAQFPGWHP